jgi:hypothetical protein
MKCALLSVSHSFKISEMLSDLFPKAKFNYSATFIYVTIPTHPLPKLLSFSTKYVRLFTLTKFLQTKLKRSTDRSQITDTYLS